MAESSRDFVLGVDLDGVCVDFYGGIRPLAAEWLGVDVDVLVPDPTYGLPEWNLDQREGGYIAFHQHLLGLGFFQDAPEIAGASAGLKQIDAMDVRIRIVTHRLFISGGHREAAAQTVDWLENHGIPYWDLCLVKDKPSVDADLYIEDTPANILELRRQRDRTIIFTNSTNRDLPGTRAESWDDVVELVANEVATARSLLARPRS